MVGYRSIGVEELEFMIYSNNPIYGKTNWATTRGFEGPVEDYGVVCFFRENIRWQDNYHNFHIKVNLPNDVSIGVSTYMASSQFGQTKVFTGREGKTEYKIEEAYTRCYWPSDIIELDIGSRYAMHFIKNTIIPFCKKHGIVLKYINFVEGEKPETINYVQVSCDYSQENAKPITTLIKTDNGVIMG